MRLIDMIFYGARIHPHRQALIQPELVVTYRALADAIEAIANHVRKLNLDPREPVGVSIASPAYLVATVLGAVRSGYSVAVVRPSLLPFLQGFGVRNLIYDSQGLMLSGGRNIRFDPAWITGTQQQSPFNPLHREDFTGVSDRGLVFFTSGTTGLPKKIMIRLGALDALLQYPITCASGAGDKILIMPGLSSAFGFNRVCEVLNVGKSACFAASSEDALALIALHRIDVVVAAVAQALALTSSMESGPSYRLDSLKTLFIGGSGIAADGLARIRSTLCRNVINRYGATEAGLVALTPFDTLGYRTGAFPLPWTELQVVDEAGNPLPVGIEGLIRYRTPQLTENIKGGGSEEIPSVRDGWFYPGDIGRLEADGAVVFAGRTSDVINCGGVKVSGARIEEIVKNLPQVKDAGACGVVGDSGMEEVWVAVIPNGAVDVDEIKQLLRTHADIGLAPAEVFIVDDFPHGEHGKVQKGRLKELLLARKKST
jgi:acyl-coenzyme A synthetase/AMP-(fatty) acid ligase